jgi:hypothetical protein
MNRLLNASALILALAVVACSPSSSAYTLSTVKPAQPKQSEQTIQGVARGTFSAKGKTVTLKYAYAALVSNRPNDGPVYSVALTDTPLTKEDLADPAKVTTKVGDKLALGELKGLLYFIHKHGYSVLFCTGDLSDFRVDSVEPLKALSVENNTVKGRDEGGSTYKGARYIRSVSFTAPLLKQRQ